MEQQQEQQLQSNDKKSSSEEYRYNPRKPKWWNKLGNNGRGATKAQKRCMKKILDGANTDNDKNNDNKVVTDNDANVDNDIRGGLKLKLRLPTVKYGSKLNWDDVFDADTDIENGIDNNGDDDNNNNNNNNKDKDRDIWLELGFGRGENVSSLLDLKLLNKNNNSKSNNFYFIGAEVSSIGIGCLCKRIDERFNNNVNNSNNIDDSRIVGKNDGNDNDDNDKGYVLYHPELDPYYRHDDLITDKEVVVDEFSNTNTNEEKKEKNQWNNRIGDVDQDDHNYSLQKLLLQNHFRIHTGDGYKLLFKIPTNTLANILITFPDPFEKINDTQYRLIQKQTLLECYRILRKNTTTSYDDDDDGNNDNGLLFLATDHEGYYDWCHQMIYEVNNDNNENGNDDDNDNDNDNGTVPGQQLPLFRLVEPCPNRKNWLPAISRYEQKGWTEGRSTKLSCWQVVVQ